MIPVPGHEAVRAQFRLAALERPEPEKRRLLALLDDAELRRGNRLLDAKKREFFLVGRGLLREILADLTGLQPREVKLVEGEFGKPYLPPHQGADGLRFNVSHAGDKLLVGICYGAEVGVDLEEVRQDLAFRPMAERYFSLREREELFGLEPARQLAAFYRCWTRKEAYLKGAGSGFSQPSTGFDVSLLPDEPPALLAHRGDPDEVRRWSIVDLPVPEGYRAALAIGAPGE